MLGNIDGRDYMLDEGVYGRITLREVSWITLCMEWDQMVSFT